jgi:hypothetical protein
MFSQAIWAPVTGGPGALLISLFNMEWRFSALAGGVEGSKLCLFSVIMPAKCVSSVSPRFHYRRLTFCFLPLAAILESLVSPSKPRKRARKVCPGAIVRVTEGQEEGKDLSSWMH